MNLGAEAEAPTAAPAVEMDAGPPVLDVSELSADSLGVDSPLVAEMAAAAKKWGFFQVRILRPHLIHLPIKWF